MTSGKFDCLIVLGTAWGQGGVTRDLLVGGKGEAIVEVVRNALEKSSEPCLQLQVGHNTIIRKQLKQSQRHNHDW